MAVKTFKEFKSEFTATYKKDIVKDLVIIDRFLKESINNELIKPANTLKNKILRNEYLTKKNNDTLIKISYILHLFSFIDQTAGNMDKLVENELDYYLTVNQYFQNIENLKKEV